MQRRASGILLHPTALPSSCGIGDLGPSARGFLEWLESAGQSVWQVLPLGPTGFGNAPYGAISAFAGNPLLISPEDLADEGLVTSEELELLSPSSGEVDFESIRAAKDAVLRRSWDRAAVVRPEGFFESFEHFVADVDRRSWLEDWALFAALKTRREGSWMDWPPELRRRETGALEQAKHELKDEVRYQEWVQFLFHRQWSALRGQAAARGIRLFGDVPIYVAGDSADVWSNQQLFVLGEEGRPSAVSGVPPDAFTPDGQLWGQPLYHWDRMCEQDFDWWIERLRAAFELVDIVRLDHFRGFVAYWRVPAEAATARKGEWVTGPGADLFRAIDRSLGTGNLVAEDLGVITPEVLDLLHQFSLPGMRVLQFGFGETDSPHLPHRHTRQTVVYTGTHDNDTTRGWYEGLDSESKSRLRAYLGSDGSEPSWDLIRAALNSVARLAIIPLQDVLGLGSEARFNVPGVAEGNWTWQLSALPGEEDALRLRRMTDLSGRLTARVLHDG